MVTTVHEFHDPSGSVRAFQWDPDDKDMVLPEWLPSQRRNQTGQMLEVFTNEGTRIVDKGHWIGVDGAGRLRTWNEEEFHSIFGEREQMGSQELKVQTTASDKENERREREGPSHRERMQEEQTQRRREQEEARLNQQTQESQGAGVAGSSPTTQQPSEETVEGGQKSADEVAKEEQEAVKSTPETPKS